MAPKSRPVEYPDLATYFEKSGDTQQHMARVLSLPQAYLSRVARGLILPGRDRAEKIAAYARIPLGSFYETRKKTA